MKVIVEGIEKKEQLKLVKTLGINEAQGFLLGRASADPESVLRQPQADPEQVQEERVKDLETEAVL
jgi:EAL domain-containing protein (putative c-di-GMP-specific phosphodiesterase class I)